jgi:hypothetical protein
MTLGLSVLSRLQLLLGLTRQVRTESRGVVVITTVPKTKLGVSYRQGGYIFVYVI